MGDFSGPTIYDDSFCLSGTTFFALVYERVTAKVEAGSLVHELVRRGCGFRDLQCPQHRLSLGIASFEP